MLHYVRNDSLLRHFFVKFFPLSYSILKTILPPFKIKLFGQSLFSIAEFMEEIIATEFLQFGNGQDMIPELAGFGSFVWEKEGDTSYMLGTVNDFVKGSGNRNPIDP